MSSLQASRKYRVPFQSIYKKMEKMGILTARMKKLQQKKDSLDSKKQPELSSFSPMVQLHPLQPKQPGSGISQPSFNSNSTFPSPGTEVDSQLREAPRHLSAMLDNGHGKLYGSEGSRRNSGKIRNFFQIMHDFYF